MPGDNGRDRDSDAEADQDADANGIGVLRSVGVLAEPDERGDPPTVTGGLRRTRDIRALGPMPTVGDVSFTGRLGRRVAERRHGVALTFARRTLAATDAAADADRAGSEASVPELATSDGAVTDVDRPTGSVGPLAADRPARVFATPRSPTDDAAGEPTGRASPERPASDWPPTPPGPSETEPPTPESAGRRPAATPPDETASDPEVDPPRRGDDRPTAARQSDRPVEVDSSQSPGPDTSRRPASAESGPSRAPADATDTGDGTETERRRRPPDEVRPEGATRAGRPDSPPTARPSRDHTAVERSDAGAFARRLDRLTGGADAATSLASSPATERDDPPSRAGADPAAGSTERPSPRRGEHGESVDGAVEASVEASTGRDPTGRGSAGRPGSSERVASLHDVSVLRATQSDVVQRTPAGAATTAPPSRSTGAVQDPGEPRAAKTASGRPHEPGVDRRGRWNPTFRRQPSPVSPEVTERPEAAGHPEPAERPAPADSPMPRSNPDSPTASGAPDETLASVPTDETPSVRPTEDDEGAQVTASTPTEARTTATPVDRGTSGGVDPPGASPRPGDPGVARRVGWQPARGRTTPVASRRASPSGSGAPAESARSGAVRTVVERSRTPGAVDRHRGVDAGDLRSGVDAADRSAPAQNRPSAADDDRASEVPDEGGPDVTTDRPESPAPIDPTTPAESTDVTTAVSPGARRGERGGRTETAGSDSVTDAGSTALERVVADRSFVRPGSETPAHAETSIPETRAPTTAASVTRADWPLGRAPVGSGDTSVGGFPAQGGDRRAPAERVASAASHTGTTSHTDAASAAGDSTGWRPRQFPDRTLARRESPGRPGDTASSRPSGHVDPVGAEPGTAWPPRQTTGQTAPSGESRSPDVARTDTVPTDARPTDDATATDRPTSAGNDATAGEPDVPQRASDRGLTPGSGERDGVTDVAGPTGTRGDSPVGHEMPGPDSAPATSVTHPGSGPVVRDPRVAVRGTETAARTPASGSQGRGPDGDASGTGRPSRRSRRPLRQPLTHRRQGRRSHDRPSAETGTVSPGRGPSAPGGERTGGERVAGRPTTDWPGDTTTTGRPGDTPATDASTGTRVGDRSMSPESAAGSNALPDETPGPVTFPADGRPGAGGVPNADSGRGLGDAPGTVAGEPASPPPVKRSGRDAQVGTTRIGSLTEMPTLTHQTGRISRPGANAERTDTVRATEPGPTSDAVAGDWPAADAGSDDWPTSGGPSGSPGPTSPGPGWDGTVGSDSTGHRTGSRRSSAGRRLAARAESTTPTATGNATWTGPATGSDLGPASGPEQAAGSPSVGDAGIDPYPDLDIRQPAPRVDATRGESQAGPRYERRPEESGQRTRHESGGVRPTSGGVERAVEEALFREGSDLSAHNAELDRVVDRLYRQVERRMEIERERRGL